MRLTSNINNNGVFFTDSNAFQMMGRKFRQNIPFDGNVYPISSMAFIEDTRKRLVVHTSQPHGVISSISGVLDLMVDRIAPRPEMDMPEPVRDNKPTKTSFYIEMLSSDEFEPSFTLETSLPTVNSIYLNDLIQHPIYSFYTREQIDSSTGEQSFLQTPLPCDVILANVKNLAYSKDNIFDGTSVTLFRRAAGCHGDVKELFCATGTNEGIRPGAIFQSSSTKFNTVHEMFLSLLKQKREISLFERVDLYPMDIKTFHFTTN